MAYQVEGVSITPAELEADSRWIRGVKAHRAAAAHQAIASTPPASPPSKTTTPQPAITPSTTTLRRHAPLPPLLQILCTLATIDYATARTADRVRINPYNSLTISTPSEPRARLYLRVSELRLGPTSYPLRAYMAAPDNALRGIIYNAVDSQTQDEIVQDLQAMNVNTPYAIAEARQMGRSQSILVTFVGTTTLPSAIVFNCGIYRCHPFRPKAKACTNCWAPGHRADVCTKPKSTLCHRCGQVHKAVEPPTCVPCCILCRGAHVTGSHPCKLRFNRNGPLSLPPPAPPTGPIHKTSRPSRRRSPSRGARSASRHRSVSFLPLPRSEASTAPTTTSPVSWKSQPHTSDPQTAALKATIAAQQLQIQELSRQLQAALARLSSPAPSPSPCPATAPSQTPPQLAPAEEPMNTAPLAASSRASSPTRHPPHKRRSPSSDDVSAERDIVRKTTSFLEAFEQRVMARFVRLEERIASVDNRVATIESHLTALDTRVAVLEARQSATEATLAHLSLPAPLPPAPTPTPSELTEAHRTAQLLRLSRTRPGRALLSTLKLSPLTPLPTSLPIPSHFSTITTTNELANEHQPPLLLCPFPPNHSFVQGHTPFPSPSHDERASEQATVRLSTMVEYVYVRTLAAGADNQVKQWALTPQLVIGVSKDSLPMQRQDKRVPKGVPRDVVPRRQRSRVKQIYQFQFAGPSLALARPDEGSRRLRGCPYTALVSARRCRLAGSLPFERPEDLLTRSRAVGLGRSSSRLPRAAAGLFLILLPLNF
ncbi:hypothetical protein HPB49_025831 [Dermacentor silvarum]|nr:hypothetical protein HPB49_025831 [Dermacentor silvarum]